jgi:Fe-S-cluster containining protein
MLETANEIYRDLLENHSLKDNFQRREVLIDSMKNLKNSGINCQSCTGLCCTFISNSMQTDPIQTLELYQYLLTNEMWNEKLVQELNEVIRNNRLDYEISTGAGSSFRRTYTCPFYNKGPKGCSISPESKPFGCLGFNAFDEDVSGGENCKSDIEVLKKREDLFEENEQKVNHYLKTTLNLYWDKLPMPVALIELDKALRKEHA